MAGCCCTQPIDQIRQVMEVNVIGADPGDPGLRPADGRHREQRGAALAAIVNFGSSVAGKFGGPFLGAYVGL
jgi:hypothetical protein